MSATLMDGLNLILAVLLGLVSCSHPFIPPSVLEVTVRPGDNITLYCDCKVDLGVYIVWYRNCSHENQPSLLLDLNIEYQILHQNFPRYDFKKNFSSDSYDLMIKNVTVSDEGLYYCGTKETKVEKQEIITQKEIYRHGNISTKITVNFKKTQQDCNLCWMLLLSVCPAVSVLSALVSSVLVYLLCHKKAKKSQDEEKRCDTMEQAGETQDEDVCYAALEIHQSSQSSKKKRTNQRSDFSTYSAIRSSQKYGV